MILKHFRNLGALLLFACAPALANHGQGDAALLAAFDAYRAGDAGKLPKQARTLNGHVLAPWTEYWQLALRLEDAHAAEVGAFLQKHSGTYVAERLRLGRPGQGLLAPARRDRPRRARARGGSRRASQPLGRTAAAPARGGRAGGRR